MARKSRRTSSKKIVKTIISNARAWARKNGMKGEISVSTPVKEDWGWWVDIWGNSEKDRVAHAKFDLKGAPTLWETHV